jgi:hypothetical protein
MTKHAVEEETERFRQLVIAARGTDTVGPQAAVCVEKLNKLYAQDRGMFSPQDARWLNVLKGFLGLRLAAHQPTAEYARRAKRKGDTLDCCWRCETPIDERFTENCSTCSEKTYQWRICPICDACGCQRSGKTLV